MAMVKTDGTITEIEGKEGGNIWRYDQCRRHVQAYPREVHEAPTKEQETRRKAFRRLLNYIRRHATTYFVMCWSDYAYKHPRRTRKGKTYILSWHQMFISYNINRVVEGREIVPLPPGYPSE